MKRIAVINQKGGVGKTTTVANLGAALAERGLRVLLIDLDPQSHLTLHFGIDPSRHQPGIYRALTARTPLEEGILTLRDRLHLVPSHIDLAAAEMELIGVVGREMVLREALQPLDDRYDFLLCDCPPSLGVLTLNALVAADEVIIPLQPHFLGLQGVGKLLETVAMVARRLNPTLTVRGIVLCMHDRATRLTGEVVADLRNFLNDTRNLDLPWSHATIFNTVIRRNIRLAECPSHGVSIFEYAPRSPGAEDYRALAAELLGPTPAPSPDPRTHRDTHTAAIPNRPADPAQTHASAAPPAPNQSASPSRTDPTPSPEARHRAIDLPSTPAPSAPPNPRPSPPPGPPQDA